MRLIEKYQTDAEIRVSFFKDILSYPDQERIRSAVNCDFDGLELINLDDPLFGGPPFERMYLILNRAGSKTRDLLLTRSIDYPKVEP